MTEQLLLECEQFIRNGGILAGSSFGRIEIPSHKMMDIDTGTVFTATPRELFYRADVCLY